MPFVDLLEIIVTNFHWSSMKLQKEGQYRFFIKLNLLSLEYYIFYYTFPFYFLGCEMIPFA